MWLAHNQFGSGEGFTGLIDEYRLSPSLRSADWIAANYAQVATDDFVVFDVPDTASMVFFF